MCDIRACVRHGGIRLTAARAGLLLVHDVTNRKSNANIRCWIEEAMGTSAYSLSPITGHGGGVMLDIVSQSKRVPAFVIGNKADLLMGGASLTSSGSQPSLSGVVVGPDSITMVRGREWIRRRC